MKKIRLSLLLLSLLLCAVGARANNVLTVHDGTATNSAVPIFGMWCDAYLKCEFVIPGDELQEMTNGTINTMTFYLSSPAAEPWGNANFQVFIREVNSSTISEFYGLDGATVVYEGSIDGTTSTMLIEFDTPYIYGGGNLLIGVYNTVKGTYKSASFLGETVSGASISNYNANSLDAITSGIQRNFIPKTTFVYSQGEAPAVGRPTNLTASEVTYNSAQISWTDNEEKVDGWQIVYSTQQGFDADEVTPVDVDSNPYTLTGLTPETTYYARVRAMKEKEFSAWSNTISFTTLPQFPKPTDLTCTGVTANTATLSWTENGDATSWEICLDDDEDNPIIATEIPFTIDGLLSDLVYTAKVRSIVGDNHSAWSESVSFETTAKIRIGSGDNTTGYLPTYTFYNYSLTEQIYTAEEFGNAAGAVQSIDFYSTASPRTRKLDIYMVNTDKSSFVSGTDWVNVTEADLVFSGDVTFAQNAWTTIAFDNPFIFDGNSNVLLAVDDNTGSYLSGPSFYVFGASNQAIRIYSDGTNYDPENPSAYTGTLLTVKNQIRILMDELPSCIPPKGLAIETAPTATSVGLTWIPGSDEQTVWDIAYKKDTDTEFTVIEEITENPFTLVDLTPETTYSVKVRGNCGDGEVSEWSNELSFTTLESCVTPTDLAAEPTASSATVSWEGASDSYNLRYREATLENVAVVTLTAGNLWGDGTGYQMLLDANANAYGTIIPATGPLTTSGNVSASVYEQFEYKIPMNADGALNTKNIVFDNSVTIVIPAGIYDWCITNPTPGNSMYISTSRGNVNGRQDDYEFEAGKRYEFVVTQDGISGYDRIDVTITTLDGSDNPASEWTVVTDATNPYKITNLTPLTIYEVQVQGDCGNEQSKWNTAYFQTLTDCPVPSDIVVDPDVNSATVSWDGYNEGYNMRYRKAAYTEEVFSDGFESGIGNWTRVDCGASNAYTDFPHTGSVGFIFDYNSTPPQYLISPVLDGVTDGMKLEFYYAAYSSYFTESFQVGYSSTTADIDAFTFGDEITTNSIYWQLFSEAIPAGTKYFCVKCTSDDQYYLLVDDFVVGLAIDADDWTTIEDIEDTNYVIEDLESGIDYELQVQGFCGEKETEWSEIVPFTTLIAVELLNDDIAEDVKNSDKLTELIGKNVKATFSGRTFFKDGKWNSLVLPFSLDEEQIANSPLAGATIKALYNTCNVTGTTVNIVFGPATSINSGSWYIFKWEDGEDIVNPVFKNVEIEYAVPYYTGSLDNGHFQVFGNFDSFEIDPAKDGCYTYYLTSEGDLKYSDKYRVLKTFRIFFRFTADNDAGALDFNLDFGDGDSTTGIVELDGTGRGNRAPEGYYNLQGVKYNGKPIQKGVYINNGHKVVVK